MGAHARVSAAVKAAVLGVVARAREHTGWGLRRILRGLGVPRGRYHAWQRRAARGQLDDQRGTVGSHPDAVLTTERDAVIGHGPARLGLVL